MTLPVPSLTSAGPFIDLIDELVKDPGRFAARTSWYGLAAIVTAFATATVLAGARSLVRRWRNGRLADGARLIEIAVPPKVEESSAAAWWSHLVGLSSPWWKRAIYGQPHLTWEFVADETGVRVQIWVPGTVPLGLVEKTIRSAWPGATLTTKPPDPPIPTGDASAGGRLVVARPEHFPLSTDHKADPLRAILGAASGLERGEHLAVQVLARPVTGLRLRRAHRAASALRGGRSTAPQGGIFDLLTPGGSGHRQPAELSRTHPERAEQVRAILNKAGQPRYEVQILYGVATSRRQGEAAQGWLRGHAHEIASTFALFTSGHQYLRRKRVREASPRLAARRLGRGYLLSVAELAALAHLPYDLAAPGVTRAGASPVAPSPEVPSTGAGREPVRILGDAEAGPPRPVALTVAGARQHLHVIGQTGVGKSTFLANLILSDAHAGRGALVIDPKGDLISEVLDRLPERAVDRTVVFDPLQAGPPPCVNVLAGPDPAFAAESIVTTFRRCFSSAWGPRLDDLMRSACLTLARVHGDKATLAQVPPLLSDSGFRREVTGKLNDELLSGFWAYYDELSPAGRAAVIGPVMNKLRAVLLRPFVRDALSGAASTVDPRHVLDGGGLILARIPKGVLGEDAARLFGSLLLAHAWQAMTPRAKQAEHARRDVAAYVDEAHNFLNLPGSVSDILAEARAYRFSLVLAHQHLSQLPKDLREAVSADARNKIYFAVSPEDATTLAQHVSPLVAPYDLSHLGAYQAAGRIVTDNAASAAFTFRTRPLDEAIPNRAETVRAASAQRFAARPDLLIPAARPRALTGGPEEE